MADPCGDGGPGPSEPDPTRRGTNDGATTSGTFRTPAPLVKMEADEEQDVKPAGSSSSVSVASSTSTTSGTGRQPSMTPAAIRKRESRLKALQKMTPEELAEKKKKETERVRRSRALKKANQSEDDAASQRRSDAERKRRSIKNEDDEQAFKRRRSDALNTVQARADQDDEHAQAQRNDNAERMRNDRNTMSTDDHLAACARRRQQRKDKKYAHLAPFKNIALANPEAIGVEPFDQGNMDLACPHCGALFFEYELLGKGTRDKPMFGNKCCQNGKISIAEVRNPSPH